MALDVTVPGAYERFFTSFTAANSTRAKILVPPQPARVLPPIASEAALPGEAAVRQRVLTGGARIIDGTVSSSDAASKDMRVWLGKLATKGADMGAITISAQNKIARTVGSYISDGWLVGDGAMLFADGNDANNGIALIVTAVSATELTFNGTLLTNGASVAALQLYRIAARKVMQIAANSGNTNAIRNTSFFSTDNSADTAGIQLGPNEALIVGLAAAVSALPAQINVDVAGALY